MAFTEFTCRSGGSNLYAGSLDGSAEASTTPLVTYANGNWDSATGIFTPASGNPVSAGVTTTHWVSIYNDGAGAPTGFIAAVTAVSSTTITVSLTRKSGTAPTTSATARTLVVGGAWLGPSGATAFPFGFVQATMTDASSNTTRINLKNNQTYSITAAIAVNKAGPIVWQGYTTTFGDLGRANISGPTTGAAIDGLVAITQPNNELVDIIVANNGATGNGAGVSCNNSTIFRRLVVNSIRGNGFQLGATNSLMIGCEAYLCNQSNTASNAGFNASTGCTLIRCISHDNAGSNSVGFLFGNRVNALFCIADTNGSHGFSFDTGTFIQGICLDAYNNGGSGIVLPYSTGYCLLENCNLVKNGGYGINGSGAGVKIGSISNCAFGTGTQANTSGTTNGLGMIDVVGSVNYASNVTPWVDPANGDFRINLAAAKGSGIGVFTQTQASYAGTIGYPDIGAAQHQDTGGGGLILPRAMNGGYSG